MFKKLLKILERNGYSVTLECRHYVVREKATQRVVAEMPCIGGNKVDWLRSCVDEVINA